MLVLGGARSGKSRYAETAVTSQPQPWIYLATAEPLDAEMEARISEHRQRRGTRWRTIEAPRDLGGALRDVPREASVLIDCLTLWLSNLMIAEADLESEIDRVESALAEMRGFVVAVANEVGFGIVPENALARLLHVVTAGELVDRHDGRIARVIGVMHGRPVGHLRPFAHRQVVGDRDRFTVRDAESVVGAGARRPGAHPRRGARLHQIDGRAAAEVGAVAKEIDRSPSQVALRWLLQRPVPCIPIIGGRKRSQIEDNLRSSICSPGALVLPRSLRSQRLPFVALSAGALG